MRPSGPRLALLALALLLVVPGSPGKARAQEKPGSERVEEQRVDLDKLREERKAVAMRDKVRRRVSRYLNAALEAVDNGHPEEAERLLIKIRKSRLNDLEDAYVLRLLAHVAYGAGDHRKAIDYFQQALDKQALQVREEAKIRFYIAQLHAQLEEWSETVAAVNRWLLYVEEPDPAGFYLRALAYFQLGDLDDAISSTRKAVDLAEPEPREQWLRLLAALYAQKLDYKHAKPILEELLLRFPKRQYWVQLSLIYGALEDYQASLAVQQVAYAQGFLTEDVELRRLARSFLYHDIPYPAAKVLEKGLKDGSIKSDAEAYELLANSWIAAREYQRSLPPLQRAAELSKDGKLNVRLGQVYMQREKWGEAVETLEKALEKGGIENLGNAQLLLGIAYYNTEQVARARRAFQEALQDERSRPEAERWIKHIAEESGGEASVASEDGGAAPG